MHLHKDKSTSRRAGDFIFKGKLKYGLQVKRAYYFCITSQIGMFLWTPFSQIQSNGVIDSHMVPLHKYRYKMCNFIHFTTTITS